jgi:hypothetical protein
MGSNSTSSGNNSLAAGSGSIVQASSTFAWNDGSNPFQVTTPNFFATQSAHGVVVGYHTPHPSAILTLSGSNGDLRIQANTAKDTNSCGPDTLGVVKSVKNNRNGALVCSCFCDGQNRNAVIDSQNCINTCGDPRAASGTELICGSTYKTCTKGTPLGFTSPLENGGTTQYWTCANLDNGKVEECSNPTPYQCTGTPPTHSTLCSGDNEDLIENTPITIVRNGVCQRYTKCEYMCDANYEPDGKGGCQLGSTVPTTIDGHCGTANNTVVSSKPTTNLCSVGTASIVNGT